MQGQFETDDFPVADQLLVLYDLPQHGSPQTSECERPVGAGSHVHVQGLVDVEGEHGSQVVLGLVLQVVGEHRVRLGGVREQDGGGGGQGAGLHLEVFVGGLGVVQEDAVCVARDEVLLVGGEFDDVHCVL